MRVLAIGDIHGCLASLEGVARAAGIRGGDTVLALGDYVDRGPDSRDVIDWLLSYARKGDLIAIRGNHDLMMMRAREREKAEDWLESGGDAALESYGGSLTKVPEAHWEFLESTRLWHLTERHFFVHGSAYPDCPLEEQPEFMLLWEKFTDPPPHESGKVMVCGHTPQRNGRPRSIGHAICIDTGACKGGWLTCLDVATGRYWQANEQGETRSDWLSRTRPSDRHLRVVRSLAMITFWTWEVPS